MTMLRSRRIERLDEPRIDPAALAQSLDDVRSVNRWLGGYRGLRRHLEDLRAGKGTGPGRRGDGGLRVLDVGAGDAATLEHLAGWAPPEWKFVGVELHPQVLALARRKLGDDGEGGIRLVGANGLRLPFRTDAFDVVLCTLTLHHFDEPEAVRLVREMARVARLRVLVNDLERNRLHYLGALALACTFWLLHPVTRHDGPLSVRRSYTANELRRIAGEAGLDRVRVRRHFPFRLVLRADVAQGADVG